MTKHILVTGGTGFLGFEICKTLASRGFRVTAMVRRGDFSPPAGVDIFVTPELPFLSEKIGQILKKVDVVIHAAGRAHVLMDTASDTLASFRSVNTEGTLALARASADAGVKRFIFVSSIAVNGSESRKRPFSAHDRPLPDSPYAQSKFEAELGLAKLDAKTGMSVLCVRPPMIYGASAPGNFALLSKLVAKRWPLPLGALDAPRSFVALDNVVDLLVHMVSHPTPPSGVYLVADAKVTTTTQFIRAMAHSMGWDARLIPVPASFLRVVTGLIGKGAQFRKMSVPLTVDIKATEERLGWTPPFTMADAMNKAFDSNAQAKLS